VTYIGTPDVDETALQAAQLGGRVLRQPADIPTVGRFAMLQDPQGAMFAAFTPMPTRMPQGDAAPAVGDFSWHELATTDWRAALTFYQRLFGWQETEATNDPAIGTYQMYGLNGRTLGGIFNKPSEMPDPPAWLAYIRVADAKQAAAAINKLGGHVVSGPMEVPGGNWIAQGVDRQGVMFAVHSLKPAARKPAARKKAAAKKKTAGRKATAAQKKAAPKRRAAAEKAAPKRRAAAKKSSRKKTAKRSRR
jgi:predicted enzyme related to lactoylglutathione lyase